MVSRGLGGESLTAIKVTTRDGEKRASEVLSSITAAERVVASVKAGDLAVVPLDVSYAFLGGSLDALERIYELKLRPASKPCPILASWEHFVDVAAATDDEIARIKPVIDAKLPVGVLVKPKHESVVLQAIPRDCSDRLIRNDQIALFMNMGGMSVDLITVANREGVVLFGSSANISGTGNSFSVREIPETMLAATDIVCESGTCKYANSERLASTIVQLDTGELTRRGILHKEIAQLL
jgi:tRNA A37 threonylcarbamoyladenosine synthetase subunit TsaC/SUA5/YrdC